MSPKRENAREQAGMPSQRQLRMGEAIRHALAEVTARGDIRDPVLRDLPITVTEVRTSPDLRRATVFVTPLGGRNMDEIVQALNNARGFYRAKVAQMVEAKFVPELTFRADASFEQARRIDSLLQDTRRGEEGGSSPDDHAADEDGQ